MSTSKAHIERGHELKNWLHALMTMSYDSHCTNTENNVKSYVRLQMTIKQNIGAKLASTAGSVSSDVVMS